METVQSVLRLVWRNDWMVAIDLKDAYLQIPIHPQSRKFIGFTGRGRAWQFKVLCFWLSTAPQVFMWVMALVSEFLHHLVTWRWNLLWQHHVHEFHRQLPLLRLPVWRLLAFCDDFLLSFGPVVLLPPPSFSDSIGSKVSSATSSPFGSSQCRLAFGSALLPDFWGNFCVSPIGFRSCCQSLLGWHLLCLLFSPSVWKSLVSGRGCWLVQISGFP